MWWGARALEDLIPKSGVWSQQGVLKQLPLILAADSASERMLIHLIPHGPPEVQKALTEGQDPKISVVLQFVHRERSELGQTKVSGLDRQAGRLSGCVLAACVHGQCIWARIGHEEPLDRECG